MGRCGRVNRSLIGQICYPLLGYQRCRARCADGVVHIPTTTRQSHARLFRRGARCFRAGVSVWEGTIHGAAAEENRAGIFERHCWEHDPNHAGAFSLQVVPTQQRLYLPAFWHMEGNTICIGEPTSFTHSWVFSALDSAARGTVLILLDMRFG